MLKISVADCRGLCPVISTQFTLEMCVAATNRENKITKTRYFGVQGRSVCQLQTSTAVYRPTFDSKRLPAVCQTLAISYLKTHF